MPKDGAERKMPARWKNKLTPDMQESICRLIAGGASITDAALLNDVSQRSIYLWRARGEKAARGKFYDFWLAMKQAESEFRQRHVDRIRDSALISCGTKVVEVTRDDGKGNVVTETRRETNPPSWQASAWLLERKFPLEYARRTYDESTTNDANRPVVTLVFDDGKSDTELSADKPVPDKEHEPEQ